MQKKIKVLHVQITENFGGIESLLTNIYENIDRSAYQFDFIATGTNQYQAKLKELGGRVYMMPSIKLFASYVRKFNSILNNNYDIVHFHKNSVANIIPILLVKCHSSHPKIIVHSHNTYPSINNIAFIYLHRINKYVISKLVDKRVACSSAAAKWMFSDTTDVQVINNGINTDKFTFSAEDRKKIRKKYNIKDNDFILGTVGRFTEQKNYKTTINIFNEINKIIPNSKLMIIGDGYLKENIITQVHQLKLEKNVLFLGMQLNVSPYLSAMDAFIMSSRYEGLGIAAVESQCEGLPTYISTNFPQEVNLTSLIRRFSLKTDLNAIALMIINSYKMVGRNELSAIKIKNSNYSLNNTVENLINLYQGILK